MQMTFHMKAEAANARNAETPAFFQRRNARAKQTAEPKPSLEQRPARIAEPRAKGLHEKAENALVKYRRTHPSYRSMDD